MQSKIQLPLKSRLFVLAFSICNLQNSIRAFQNGLDEIRDVCSFEDIMQSRFHCKISETVQTNLTFILNILSEFSIHFTQLARVLAKMFVFSHNMVFIENEAALLCVTMREQAREFAAKIQCITF